MKKHRKVILGILIGCVAAALVGMLVMNRKTDLDRNGQPADIDVCPAEEYSISVNVLSESWTKYTAELTICNLTDHPMVNWMLYFDYKDKLLSLDQGAIMADEYGYRLCGDQYSESTTIPAGGSLSFTITARGEVRELTDVQLSYRDEVVIGEERPTGGIYEGENCRVEVSVAEDDGSFCDIGIKVTNTSEVTIADWAFAFETTQKVMGVQNAETVSSYRDGIIVLYSLDKRELLPEESVYFTYLIYSDFTHLPTEFTLGEYEPVGVTNGCENARYTGILRGTGAICAVLIRDTPEEYTKVLSWLINCDIDDSISINTTRAMKLKDEENADTYSVGGDGVSGAVFQISGIITEDAVTNIESSREMYYKNGSAGVTADGLPCVRNQMLLIVEGEQMPEEELVEYLEDYNATIVGKTTVSYQVEFSETVTAEEAEEIMAIIEQEEWIVGVYPNLIRNESP